VSWLIRNWRLKLLALVLASGLLTAVAFSENPPVFKTVDVRISYPNIPAGLALVNPPRRVPLSVYGLNDAVGRFSASSVGVTVDMARVHKGANQTFDARPTVVTPGVTPQVATIPILIPSIEDRVAKPLDIEVRLVNQTAGITPILDKTYAVCGNDAEKCKETVTGPASLLDGLTVYIKYDGPVLGDSVIRSGSQTVLFEQNGRATDLAKQNTEPNVGWDHSTVEVHIEAKGTSVQKTVGLHPNITGSPACGFAVTGVTISTPFPQLSGPADIVSKTGGAIELPAISIAGATGAVTQTVAITPSDPALTVNPARVTVSVGVQQAFSCVAPTPTPTRSP
jgi:hypothetical protein